MTTCDPPVVVAGKVKLATPLLRAMVVGVPPSTETATPPLGVPLVAEVTLMVRTSVAPAAGVAVAAGRVVVVAARAVPVLLGQAATRWAKSMEPSPEASS